MIDTANEWQNRPLKKFYTFLFVGCLYVSIRKEMETKSCAVYVILVYDVNGTKDILGIGIGESEGKHYWMQIFDELKARGVEDILFISMDGVSALETMDQQKQDIQKLLSLLIERGIPVPCSIIDRYYDSYFVCFFDFSRS